MAVLGDDGTLHILIAPEITGTQDAIDAISPLVDEVDKLGTTAAGVWAGIMPETTMDLISSAVGRINSYSESLDLSPWQKFWAYVRGESVDQGVLDQSMKYDFNADTVAELSAYVGEMVAAIQQGKQVSAEDVQNLQEIVTFLQGLDTTETGTHILEGVAEGMTAAGWDTDAETVASNLETALNTALGMQPYKLYSTATLDQNEEGFGVVTLPALSTLTYDNAIQSQKVTFSFMARSDDATAINGEVTNGMAIEFDLCDDEQYDADGNLLEPTRTKYVRIPMFSQDLSNEWKKYTWTGVVSTSLFTSGNGNVTAGTRFYVQLQNYSTGTMQVKKLKLELGAIATDWSPAPEDISTDIDAQGDLITDLQQSFADMEVRQNEITATVGEMREANEETYNTLKEYVDTTVSQSASGAKIDIVKMQEQGMDADGNIIAYKTTTGFSFDNTGLHISETGNSNITNDLTPTGMTVKRSGEEVLVADVSGVQATDVTVKLPHSWPLQPL